jgi:hypothetical protein
MARKATVLYEAQLQGGSVVAGYGMMLNMNVSRTHNLAENITTQATADTHELDGHRAAQKPTPLDDLGHGD